MPHDIDVYSTARDMAAAVAGRVVSARERATEADAQTARGGRLGPLHGLPHALKDTHEVAGWRTTFGSPLRADHVPQRDGLVVERIRAAGVVTIGKTNVPEWAAGSHTFNPIFGTTRNPYDLSRSAGGSSGGAAAAPASGMVPLADGSDMSGSLRNPASLHNVVGLRPGVGRVPSWPATNAWEPTSVSGPMARDVDDLALLLSVLAGPSPRAPLSLETPGSAFAPPLDGDLAGVRVALSVDLGGAFPVDHAVADVVRAYQQLTAAQDRMGAFFETYDVLALPVSQVPPFGADEEYPTLINGEPLATYLDWMRSAYLITVTGCPAISMPAGFTPEGWPVGIQVVGPMRSERRLLEIAHAFEQASRIGDRRPRIGPAA